jgi:hypothetical protein
LPRPIFDLSSSWGLKTIAHHANMRQMANHEMKNLSPADSDPPWRARIGVHHLGIIVAALPASAPERSGKGP